MPGENQRHMLQKTLLGTNDEKKSNRQQTDKADDFTKRKRQADELDAGITTHETSRGNDHKKTSARRVILGRNCHGRCVAGIGRSRKI